MAKKRSATEMEDGGKPADDSGLAAHHFAEEDNGIYQCQKCKMLPQDLRAEGSLSEARPTLSFCMAHSKICRADVFDLSYCARLIKDFISSENGLNSSMVVQPRFKAIIREIVGDDEALVEVFTHGVEAVLKKKSDADFATPGLYKELPTEVSYERVSAAFQSFIVTTSDLFGTLGEYDLLVRFLQCICPSFEVPAEVQAEIAKKRANMPPSTDEDEDADE